MPEQGDRYLTMLQAAYAAGRRAAVFDHERPVGQAGERTDRNRNGDRKVRTQSSGDEWHH